VLREVLRLTPAGDVMVNVGRLPTSPRVRQIISFAVAEAEEAGSSWRPVWGEPTLAPGQVTADHFLLALCRSRPSAAVRVLEAIDLPPRVLAPAVLDQLGRGQENWLGGRPEAW
jgi:hypothetical protein